MQNKDALREKLEIFIRKYYQNRLIKGLIYGVGLSLSYLFVVAIAEYFGRFPSSVRLGLFVALVVGLAGILGYYVIYPVTKLLRIGKRISYTKAAHIIGKHFPEVDDKLTNTLELQHATAGERALVEASIRQRLEKLSPIPFQSAVDFGENKRYWPVLVVPVLVFLGVLASGFWDDFSESGKRIAAYDMEFVPEAPFQFVLNNEDLVVEQGGSLTLKLGFAGSSIPADAAIVLPSGQNRMTHTGNGDYQYTLDNLQEDVEFRFAAAGFNSQRYTVDVIPVPQVNSFTLRVMPPPYTGMKPFETEAKLVQDILEGSEVEWSLSMKQADRAFLVLDTAKLVFAGDGNGQFTIDQVVASDLPYSVVTSNDLVEKTSIKENKLKVVKDQYPSIEVAFDQDSTNEEVLYYNGSINDDYGFSRLDLVIERGGESLRSDVSISRNSLTQQIGSVVVLDSLAGEDTQELKIYLEVFDNDGVNGAKARRSRAYSLRLLGKEDRKEKLEEEYQKYFSSSQKNQQEQKELEKSLEQMQKELMESKSLSWKDKNKLKELLRKQKDLLEKQQENQKRLEELKKEEEKLGEKPEEIKEKEEKIEKIDNEQKEIDELMKEIDKLMEELDMEKLQEKVEKMKQKNEQNRQAEARKEDLMKDLKFQKDVLEQARKLEELSKKMEELSKDEMSKKEESGGDEEKGEEEGGQEEKQSSAQKEVEEQKKVEEEFEKVKKEIERLREENKEFDQKAKEQEMDKKQEEATDEMQKANENMQQNKQQPANQNQKKAGEKMSEMSQSMQMSMMQMQSEANQENIQTLRQILENLETLSFGVENLSERTKEVNQNDPAFKELLTEQKRLQDGAKVIEDSLVALSKRVPEIEQVVFEELDKIKSNLSKGIENLEELRNAQAASNQQYVMTSANNLALMLDESLRNMQQMQAQMQKGKQNCQNPGGGSPKPSMQNVKDMLGELGKKMDRMKKGQQKGKGRNGKEIVEMLSRQEQLRRAMEQMQEGEGSDGSKGNRQKAIEEMKKLEEDMLDGRLDDNYKKRLAEIETRLLESEKAELEQKQDEKRESQTADQMKQLYQEELEKYLKEKQTERESIDRLPLNFQNYYKNQTSQYLNTL